MALVQHGLVRMTQDVDVLMTDEGLEVFRQRCVGRGYVPAFAGARKSFRDAHTQVRIEIITAGEYPGDGKPKAVVFPDPAISSLEADGLDMTGNFPTDWWTRYWLNLGYAIPIFCQR
jgi:hypothetical protein